MFYGLTFSSGSESLQVVMDTAGLRFYARATNGGAFGSWKLVCGGDDESGEGGSDAITAARAEVANKAYKLAVPMTISFTGDVSGDVTFDGSANVTANLSGNAGGGDGLTEDTARNLCHTVITEELNGSIGKAIKAAIAEHLEYQHNQNP